MFIEVVEAGGTALSLFENRKSILRILRRFQRRIFRGVWRVAVFGDGGTGKTTLGRYLAGEFDTDKEISAYRETIDNANYSLPGDIPCVILVPPGQERRRPQTWLDLYRLLAEGKAGGIINVFVGLPFNGA
jgi:GTPase SAR1 family protein